VKSFANLIITMRSFFVLVSLATFLVIVVSASISEVRDDADSEGDNSFEILNNEDTPGDGADSEVDSGSFEILNIEDGRKKDSCESRDTPCKVGQYLDYKCRCRRCPNGMTSPYSPSKPYTNVGINTCRPCRLPFRMFECPRWLAKNCKYLRLCVKPGDKDYWTDLFKAFQLPPWAVKMIPLMYSDVYEAPTFEFRTRKSKYDPNAVVEDAQDAVSACERDSAGCCLPGFYGIDANECTECPKEHSSPFSSPRDDCSCPNNSVNSCARCNICEILDAGRQCTSKCKGTLTASCQVRDVMVNGVNIPAGTCYDPNATPEPQKRSARNGKGKMEARAV